MSSQQAIWVSVPQAALGFLDGNVVADSQKVRCPPSSESLPGAGPMLGRAIRGSSESKKSGGELHFGFVVWEKRTNVLRKVGKKVKSACLEDCSAKK